MQGTASRRRSVLLLAAAGLLVVVLASATAWFALANREAATLEAWVEIVRRPGEVVLVNAEPGDHFFAAFRDERKRLVIWMNHRHEPSRSCSVQITCPIDPLRKSEMEARQGRTHWFTGRSLDGEASVSPISPFHTGPIEYSIREGDTGFSWSTSIPWTP